MLQYEPSWLMSLADEIEQSPRWLLTLDRQEDALKSLRLLRQGAYTEEEIQQEHSAIQAALNNTVKKGSFFDMFRGSSYTPSSMRQEPANTCEANLKRTAITIGVNVFLQLTGQNFMSKYGAIFIQSLNTVNPFAMTSINSALGIVSVFATQLLTDKVGRM
jgi:hypothetical protein